MMPYVCVLGFLPALYGFSGYDGSAHLAEETIHAATVGVWSWNRMLLGFGFLRGWAGQRKGARFLCLPFVVSCLSPPNQTKSN